jgi:hypothetical protein
MHRGRKLVVAALMAVLLLAARAASATPAEEKAKDAVLRRLDVAAANFHSTSADFEFDSVTTDPIPDKDVQKGTVYYERKGNSFQMAAHIETRERQNCVEGLLLLRAESSSCMKS